MLARTFSLSHPNGHPEVITIETDVSAGLPGITIVGLATKSIEESRERLRSAIRNSGLEFPPRKTVINLAPADIAKHGTGFELAIALGILSATRQIPTLSTDICYAAELALDGSLRPAHDVLATILSARKAGFTRLIVDAIHTPLSFVPKGIEILRAPSLQAVYDWLVHERPLAPYTALPNKLSHAAQSDFREIHGLTVAKRALEIAAAGNHNILMIGPPGCGKTMLAQSLPSILPELSREEYAEVMYQQSLSGLPATTSSHRPFRSPHHTSSYVAMVGGGQQVKPGEITLAHNGVLFLDELPEFSRQVLEALRQPLEDNEISIARAQRCVIYPADFLLVAAMNPCPCGYAGSQQTQCVCRPGEHQRYMQRLSGPLLDRFDIYIHIQEPQPVSPFQPSSSESSATIRNRVRSARGRQARRLAAYGMSSNSHIRSRELRSLTKLTEDAQRLAEDCLVDGRITQRGLTRLMRVARTIADLEKSDKVCTQHICEALHYRPSLIQIDQAAKILA